MLSFEWLINPVTPEAFFSRYYERQPLLSEGGDPAKFGSLLSVAAVDRYLATSSPVYPEVFLVDAARELKPSDYTRSDEPRRIDLQRAYRLFDTGATISIRQLQQRLPGLAELCRAMEQAFSSHFQTNIYLSPRDAQGFKTHYDSHDVFVLQVAGSKHWTLYEPGDSGIELPLHGQRFKPGEHVAGPPARELKLKAGDVLYCPRGVFHSARATDEISLHITLGLMARTWADVMIEAMLEVCLASPAFRANLPAGFARPDFDSRDLEATFKSLVETFARDARLAPVLEGLAESFVASRQPDLSGSLEALDRPRPVTLESRAAARPHLVYRLREEGGTLRVLFGPTQISLPAFARPTVEAVLSGKPFRVCDLPGPLDDPGKIVLVRRLIREGMVVIQNTGAAHAIPAADRAAAGGTASGPD